MALPTFKARIVRDVGTLSGRDTYTIELLLDVWTGTDYGRSTPFLFDTGAEASVMTAAIVPGEKMGGLLGLRDVHPRLEFYKLGDDLFLVPPPAV